MRVEMDNILLSREARHLKIDDDTYIWWNRLFPSLLILNKDAVEYIKGKDGMPIHLRSRINKNMQANISKLLRYKLLYRGSDDPYHELFIKSLHEKLELAKRNIQEFYKERKAYSNLYLTNSLCNLNCEYCVTKYNAEPPSREKAGTKKDRSELIYIVIDQYFKRRIEEGIHPITINLNGGEILTEWEFIKGIIERNSRVYSGQEIKYSLNTNMTLMTREIAQFMDTHNFDVYISIDGYKDAHNRTRKYRNGKGTFDDVIRGLKIFREFNRTSRIAAFQGTIENSIQFDPSEVYKMKKYGFNSCRLAPNLLNVPKADGIKKAEIMGKLLELNSVHKFKVGDSYFVNMEKLINMEKYAFFFNCVGLSCFPSMGIGINMSEMKATCMCGFINKASIPLGELGYNIYNPKLGALAIDFIIERLESIKRDCADCDLIGVCRGGCILNGLDNENKINVAACAFQKEMWKKLIGNIYKFGRTKDRKNRTEEPTRIYRTGDTHESS